MLNKNVETFIACDSEYDEAKIVLFGAPFDGTTSYRAGTRFAPRAIRGESYSVETYSMYQDKDLEDCAIFDSGDLDLCFGNPARVLDAIKERSEIILNDGKIPFMIGGEHLVSLGLARALYVKYPNLKIVHFDAHADLRSDYLGEELSHASVIRRCHDLVGDNAIYQFGIRSAERAEIMWAKGKVNTTPFNFDGLENLPQILGDSPVYFTLDLDVLDSSVFCGTGTPEAGGVSFDELRKAVTLVCSKLNIVGCDINELAPMLDASGASTAVAIKILREMLLAIKR